MKIFNAAQIREADRLTIIRQGISSGGLMERVGNEVYLWLKNRFPDKETVFHVFCGKGNNGGDGLVIARLLRNDKYTLHLTIAGENTPSPDFAANLEKINREGIPYNTTTEISSYGKGKAVVVDALFGTGLTREPAGEYKGIIEKINNSGAYVVSVDVPSGLFLDRPTGFAVKADEVLTFQFPKLAFFLPGNYRYINKMHIIDIGLDKDFINDTVTGYYFTDKFEAYRLYRPVPYYAHKGTRGHVLVIGGSYGKTGAVHLAARAALTSGCGLVTALVPQCGYVPLQASFPEAMVLTNGETHLQEIAFALKPAAIAIGPGMGTDEETQQALHNFLFDNKIPMVVDADALNILSENLQWLELLPPKSVITPHPKELERLMGTWNDDFDKIDKLKAFSKKHSVIIVAKDARTLVVNGDAVYVNSTGNAALATGGSGDVLAGLITGLIAQQYTPADAAVFGVYLHGLSADIGVAETGTQAFTASSILHYLGRAYLQAESSCQ
ncbi:hypothetical protein CHU92_14915 [Flavobacterium cyanobacteriorum]|uniref:Bifunctional NAD(P)H-hydrate repair enzyme n=1 Tax=Flavobacterium cyanobacteriorum TaxID=2022802 RepID=A0A255YRU9_9FLAO|nr:NAD(P)H-hydrate dehydratase [Flavobacterium cyanobacteriorum]OYQ31932.1 hypothetical protein CHU92_14915 [Flavobacterium cyanobacteriorum]